ncbi:MAG TPA: PIN domain-containing protein [Rhodobacteraceae bacterium]|nr:PIN domain-containing protein [Paracoccaceae bacterium]
MRLAGTGLFRARWSDDIHNEWICNVLRDRQDIPIDRLERVRHLMDEAVPDCLVKGYERFIPVLELPDPGDRHVLAAAICCQAGVIVTFNLDDFPKEILEPYGIEAQHPDEFILHLMDLDSSAVCNAASTQRRSLKNPPKSPDEFLDILKRQELPGTVSRLEKMINFL